MSSTSSWPEADQDDPATIIRREAQLLAGWPESPLVAEDGSFEARRPAGAVPARARTFA